MKKIDVSNPLALSKIIASDGLTNQIPADASSVAEQYNASQDVGFPEVTMKPVEIGGEAPDGRDFNGFLQLLSSHLFASQNGGIYTFNADVSSAIGGYPQGAILGYIDANGDYNFVKSLIDDNTYNFVNNPAYIDNIHWAKIVYPGAANNDLSNLSSTGKNISNWSSNVSNCITKIPQDIKVEIDASHEFIAKAGTKVYFGDNTSVILGSDASLNAEINWGNEQFILAIRKSNNTVAQAQMTNTTSASTNPATSYTMWFNTTDGKCYINDGSGNASEISFPIALVMHTNGTGWTNIDQVFNGLGYIGSTIFVLPGVKGLIPNGKNADGTYKNIVINQTNVLTRSITYASDNLDVLFTNSGTVVIGSGIQYDIATNTMLSSGGTLQRCAIARISTTTGGQITSFSPKYVLHTVDYSDFQNLDNNAVHRFGNETINGEKTFTVRTIKKTLLFAYNDSTTSSGSEQFNQIAFSDKNNHVFGTLEFGKRGNGNLFAQMNMINPTTGNWMPMPLGFEQVKDTKGTCYTYCPTPSSNATGNEIATTSFVKTYLQYVNVLPANPDGNCFYAIPE